MYILIILIYMFTDLQLYTYILLFDATLPVEVDQRLYLPNQK